MTAVREARWEALGTSVHVLVTDDGALEPACEAVRGVLAAVDSAYSRFRDDSEIAVFDRSAGRPVRVTPLLFRAIEAAVRAARMTDGACDPTLGQAIRALGYDRDFRVLPADGRVAEIRVAAVPGWSGIEMDAARRTVRVPRGVRLDLGSTGKALAADLAATAAVERSGASGLLVNLGGDIATTGRAVDGGWRIRSADDSSDDPSWPGDVVAIEGGAVATSSTVVRRWVAGGVERHHILDPRTGLPAAGPWRTATVAATTCVDANAASTAAIVLGADAIEWLTATGLPARLVRSDGTVLGLNGWPEPLSAAS